jgi:hypothetical protein
VLLLLLLLPLLQLIGLLLLLPLLLRIGLLLLLRWPPRRRLQCG